MKKLLFPMALADLSISGAAAQSVFEGTWKADLSNISVSTPKPAEFLVQDGISTCKTCDPPITVRADGKFHPITDNPHYDSGAYEVLSDHHAKATNMKNGKVVQTVDIVISPDGNTMSQTWAVIAADGSPLRSGTNILKRVAKGPSGSQLISGTWGWERMENVSDPAGSVWTYKVSGDQLIMTTPTGQSFTAKLDGTEAPYKGDPETTSVRLKLIGSDTLEETDLRDGKVISVSKMTVAPDGKTAKVINEDKQGEEQTQTFEAVKQ